jgi:hypothetical protein
MPRSVDTPTPVGSTDTVVKGSLGIGVGKSAVGDPPCQVRIW